MKKLLSVLMSLVIMLSIVSFGSISAEEDNTYKMSEKLKEKISKMSDDEEVEVYLWLEDIDHDEVEREVKEKTGIGKEDMQRLSDSIYNTYCKAKGITIEELQGGKHKADPDDWAKVTEDIRQEVSDKVDEYIHESRVISSAKQSAKNKEMLSDLKIAKENRIFESKYSPMNIVKVTVGELKEIINSDKVYEVDIFYKISGGNSSASTDKSSAMSCHKTAMSFSNSYSGSGVKIGQLEFQLPDNSNNYEFATSTINLLDTEPIASSSDNYHASRVASIMVGNYGLVNCSTLYAKAITDFYSDVESLINQDVNIINMSFFLYRTSLYNYYDTREKWLDHVAYDHNISVVVIAGNNGDANNNYTVNCPGLSYNVITVGSANCVSYNNIYNVNSTASLSTYSCYLNSIYCSKPEVVASGENFPYIKENGIIDGYTARGTSFSAPMVTSACAELMQQNATLKNNPTLVKAVIMASCRSVVSTVTNETWGQLNTKQGAGLMSKNVAVSIVANNMFSSSSTQSSSIYVAIPSTFGLPQKGVAATWQKNNGLVNHTSITNHHYYMDEPITDYDLQLLNPQTMSSIKTTATYNTSSEFAGTTTQLSTLVARIHTPTAPSFPVEYAIAWYS